MWFWNKEKRSIGQVVSEVIFDLTGVWAKDIKPKTHLEKDLDLDELDVIELVMTLEEEMDVTILDDDADKWKTVGDIVKYLEGIS